MRRILCVLLLLVGCTEKPRKTWFKDGFFSRWDDRRVFCSIGADATHSWTLEDLRYAIDRASDEKLVLHTFGHAPGLNLDEYTELFDYAHQKGVESVTYSALVDTSRPRAAWAFSVDDWGVDTWASWRDLLRQHQMKFTFFIANWDQLTDAQRKELHDLANDGHDIQPHGLHHIEAKAYTETYGVDAYIKADVTPELEALRAEGFNPTTFAYPFGAHTDETNAALLKLVPIVRTANQQWCDEIPKR